MKERNTKSMWMAAAAVGGCIVILIVFIAILTSSSSTTETINSAKNDLMAEYGQQLTAAQANKLKESFQKKMKQNQIESNHKIEALEKKLAQEKSENNSSSDTTVTQRLSAEIDKLKQQVNTQASNVSQRFQDFISQTKNKDADDYADVTVGQGNGEHVAPGQVTWIKDNTVPTEETTQGSSSSGGFDLFGSASNGFGSKKSKSDDDYSILPKEKYKPIAFYTIPPNSLMTGIIPLQPLIGRIPKANGNVFQPFSFMFVTEHPTLMAQGHEAPMPIAKMTGTAVCVGDFLSESVSCQVTSLTFIFDDGHYQVIDTKQKQTSGQNGQNLSNGLGTIANSFGNPQIGGELKSAMALRLAMTTGFGALTAYGQGLSQAQVQNFGGDTAGIFQSISNANNYAMGQAISGAAAGAQDEWNEISKTIYDYVFVPNWNPVTRKLIRLNITINEPIEIDYDKNGRLINYERQIDENAHNIIL
jgi:integrating conjugative element protein (TIGR03752 family)